MSLSLSLKFSQFVFIVLLIGLASGCNKKNRSSNIQSGNLSSFPLGGAKGRLGNIADELAKFDARLNNKRTLDPEIVFQSSDENGDLVEAVGQLDRTEVVTIGLPPGYKCTGNGEWMVTGDIEILQSRPDKCEIEIAFKSGVTNPAGSAFFSGEVLDENNNKVDLAYRVNLEESRIDSTSVATLTNIDFTACQPNVSLSECFDDLVDISGERYTIGNLSAIGKDGSSHHFVFPEGYEPPFQFTYPISEAVPESSANVEYDFEYEVKCSVQQNRQFFGAADYVDDLITAPEADRNCPFKITKMDYENRNNLSLQFELLFKEIEGAPGRYEIDGLQGIGAGLKNKAQLVLEVVHYITLPPPAVQTLRVVQTFVLPINFLGQPADDVENLIQLPARPGADTIYFRTEGQVSAHAGFEIARKVQNQLRAKYGNGIKFYAANPQTLEENDWIYNQIRALTWIGAVDMKKEGTWTGREELDEEPQILQRGVVTYRDYIETPLPIANSSSFRIWLPGEPNNRRGREHCAHLGWQGSGLWNDWRCENGGVMVFELELTSEFSNQNGNGPFFILE